MTDVRLEVAQWKYDKRWVYSVTYDEALTELHLFTVPTHDRLGIPGHVEVVAGHIGQERQIGQSSYNGMHHMNGAQLREMVDRGWGVGNHSWSHGVVADDPELELKKAKEAIEQACGYPVTIYVAPGSNANMVPPVLQAAERYGYLGAMGITDELNYPDFGFWLNRPPLHEKFSDLYDSAFDPDKRITQAKKNSGWIVDYLHCPLEKAMHDYKDVTAAHHAQRLEAVAEAGRYDCWFANPDRVVDYRYLRGAARITEGAPGRFTVDLSAAKAEIVCRELTFRLAAPYPTGQLVVLVDGREAGLQQHTNGVALFTVPVRHGSTVEVVLAPNRL